MKDNKEMITEVEGIYTEFRYISDKYAFRALSRIFTYLEDRGEKVPEEVSIHVPGIYTLVMFRNLMTGLVQFCMCDGDDPKISWKGTLDREGLEFIHLLAEREVR